MSTDSVSLAGPSVAASLGAPSLADVLARVAEFPVSKQARLNMASGIRAFCRVIDRAPGLASIHTPVFRRQVATAAPGAVGMSSARWRNVKSDVRRAIRLSGLSVDVGPEQAPLTAAWEHAARLAPDAIRRSVLRRFGRFCCSLQLEPQEVADSTVDRFFSYLDLNQLSKTPERTVRDLIRAWNCFVAQDREGSFAVLALRSSQKCYTLTWDDLPKALAEDARAFREASLKPALFDGGDTALPVRPATAKQRDRMLRRLASAEILAGIDRSTLQSLADLVHPDQLQRGLQFFIDRNGGHPNKQVFDMALLALVIARRWTALPSEQVAVIKRWGKKFRTPQDGMTWKNRERLRQFGDEDVIRALLNLPEQLIARAERHPVDSRSALMVQKAVALALLTAAPLRLDNLRVLDRQRHFRRAFSVDLPHYQLVIPAAEVKNKVDLEIPVPSRVMAMIERYLAVYQPLLTSGHASTLLFPGRSGQPKHDTALRRNISESIYKELGLHVHPHLFRHLAALLFLKVHPGQYESVRQLLGHKNIQTTINFYAGFETDEAMHRYNQVIDRFREGTGSELLGRDRTAIKKK